MTCERSECDFVPVGACQRVQFGRAGLGCFGELWDEVGDGSMPVSMADLDKESVEEEQFADAPQAVDCVVCAICVSGRPLRADLDDRLTGDFRDTLWGK